MTEGAAPAHARRSARSIAFQRAWSAIPKTGLIPDKADFFPERMAGFLADIYLVELNEAHDRRLVIRLGGQNIRDHLGVDLKGMSYIDFVPEEHREMSGTSMRRMFGSRPCGRWIRKEIVHRDGYRELIEMTQFPMIDAQEGCRLVLGIIEGLGEGLRHEPPGEFLFENYEGECFIDTGAGLPDGE